MEEVSFLLQSKTCEEIVSSSVGQFFLYVYMSACLYVFRYACSSLFVCFVVSVLPDCCKMDLYRVLYQPPFIVQFPFSGDIAL